MSKVQRDEKGLLKKGSKLHQKYELKDLIVVFEELAQKCIEGEYLSMQECQMHSGLPHRTFYDVVTKYPELEDSKKQMNDAIIANVNRMALNNKFNPTASIWRMKNLGEKDRSEVEVTQKETQLFNLD
jgi:hypothetical protein